MSILQNTIWTLISLALITTTASQAEVGVTDKQVIIATSNALSGNNEFSGKQTTIGIKTYFDSLNDEGGVGGRKIKVITCDDKYEPEGAIACVQKLTSEGAFAITGLVGSALLAKYMPMCTNKKVPAVGFYSGPTFVSAPAKRYIFTVRPGYRAEEHQFIDHLWDQLKIRTFGIIYQNDSYGADHLEGMKEALAKHKAEIVGAASYERNSTDLSAAFAAVKKANPQAVSLAANNVQCLEIIKMARAEHWNPIFFINSGANVDGFMQKAGAEADGVVVGETVPSPTRTDIPFVAKYVKALKQYYPNEKPCYTSLRGYIDALVVGEGIKRAGKNLTRESFVDALDSIHNMDIGIGPDSKINYSPTDHYGIHQYIFGVIKKGDVVPITDWKKLR
jgi:branched-chain amino acid transport system substrate-binding protein